MENLPKKFMAGLVLVAVLAMVLLAYKGSKQKSGELASVKIGALAPLSGQLSVVGERMRNGMQLAKHDMIASGVAKNIDIIYEDACDAKSSLNAVNKLINQDRVKIIGSAFCLFGQDAVIPVAEQKKVVFFNTAANPESYHNKDYVFSTNISIQEDAHKIADYAVNELGAKRVAMVRLDTSFGESYARNFKARIQSLGGEMIIDAPKLPDATDFRTDLSKIKSQNADALVIIHFGSSLGNAIKQARELGITAPILGDYESEDPTVLKFAGAAAEGMIISSSQPTAQTETIAAFQKKYLDTFGELPDVLAANAYDSAVLQIKSYVKCSGDTECIVQELRNTKNYSGVSGTITINPDHSVQKPTIFKIVKNGAFVALEDK